LGNPQERPEADALSHDAVAGLFVGEAWFGLTTQRTPKLKVKHGFTIRPRFAIQMNDLEAMAALSLTLDKWGIPHSLLAKKSKGETWNDSARIEIQGCKRLQNLLNVILPHLFGNKRRAAELVLEFIELRASKVQASPYGDDEIRIVNELRAVNGGNRGNKILLESSETIRRTLKRVPPPAKR
jgi:hypothetical protein